MVYDELSNAVTDWNSGTALTRDPTDRVMTFDLDLMTLTFNLRPALHIQKVKVQGQSSRKIADARLGTGQADKRMEPIELPSPLTLLVRSVNANQLSHVDDTDRRGNM